MGRLPGWVVPHPSGASLTPSTHPSSMQPWGSPHAPMPPGGRGGHSWAPRGGGGEEELPAGVCRAHSFRMSSSVGLGSLSERWAQLSGLSSWADGKVEWMPWGM